jgi:hypothetical protein
VASVKALLTHADPAFAQQWSFEERASVIADLDRIVELATLYRARVVTAHRDDGRWARHGDRSFDAYRGRTSRAGTGAARAEVELAEGLAALPEAAQAVEDERVSMHHAEVLTRLRARSSAKVQHALEHGGAAELLAAATAARMDAPTFARRAAAWAAARDAEDVERSFAAVRARRSLRLLDREGGGVISGFVDPVVLATLRSALEAHTPVPAVGDDRTPEQRAADALDSLAQASSGAGAHKIGAQIRPHLSLLVHGETWSAVRRGRRAGEHQEHAARIATSDAGGDENPGGRDGVVVMPELDDGTVVPLSELERIACDCEVTRLVLDADGVPLDVGRTQRTYSQALRRAILVRDGHCQWPGCTLRASWCEVHHVRWFSRGGATSLSNGLTLCSFHHHAVHRRDVVIAPVTGGVRFTFPDGTVIGSTVRETGARRMFATRRREDRGRASSPGDGTPSGRGAPGDRKDRPCRATGGQASRFGDASGPDPPEGERR